MVPFWADLLNNENTLNISIKALIGDFILLLLLCRRRIVFQLENSTEPFPAGSNKSIVNEIVENKISNPTHDFTLEVRNYLDVFKRILFKGFYFLALATVILAGSTSVSILSFGYITAAFVFYWRGADFYLMDIRKIHRSWKCLIAYNVFVIVLKVVIQLISCYLQYSHLFNVPCNSFQSSMRFFNKEIRWDGIAFAFLLFQLRIFGSYYFYNVVQEKRIDALFPSRYLELNFSNERNFKCSLLQRK